MTHPPGVADTGVGGRVGTVPVSVPPPLVEAFTTEPATAGIFCDFDGTLSDIVLDPASAKPVAGSVEMLSDLAGVFARVGVLSGRPLAFLQQFFPTDLFLAGLYGLETTEGGERRDHPQAGAWREVISDVAASSADRGPAGMRVEDKGLSITLHYRGAQELAPDVEAWAATQASRSGLVQRPARMSVELHPPIDADKRTALLAAAEGLSAVCYIGDDVGDLPAFDALDELAGRGVTVLRVVVRSDELAPALAGRADVTLTGPAAVVEFLGRFRPPDS